MDNETNISPAEDWLNEQPDEMARQCEELIKELRSRIKEVESLFYSTIPFETCMPFET